MWRGFWGLGFALLSPLSLTPNTDKKLQKITSRRGLAQEAEHVRKKRERARKKKTKKPRRNPAKSVHVCAVWTGWRVKLLQKGAEICASSRSRSSSNGGTSYTQSWPRLWDCLPTYHMWYVRGVPQTELSAPPFYSLLHHCLPLKVARHMLKSDTVIRVWRV